MKNMLAERDILWKVEVNMGIQGFSQWGNFSEKGLAVGA